MLNPQLHQGVRLRYATRRVYLRLVNGFTISEGAIWGTKQLEPVPSKEQGRNHAGRPLTVASV
jgi:hypothetical protein